MSVWFLVQIQCGSMADIFVPHKLYKISVHKLYIDVIRNVMGPLQNMYRYIEIN